MADDPVKTQNALTKATEDTAKAEQKIVTAKELSQQLAKSILENEKRSIENLEKEITLLEQRKKFETDRETQLEEELKIEEDKIKIKEQYLETYQKELDTSISLLEKKLADNKIDKEQYDREIEFEKKRVKDLKDSKEALEQHKKSHELQKESLKAIGSMQQKTHGLITTFTGITDGWKETFLGSLIQANKVQGGLSLALNKIGKQIKEQVTVANLLGSTYKKVGEASLHMMYAQDEATSAFNKTTGAAGAYDDVIAKVGHYNLELGIDMKDAAAALGELRDRMTDFTRLSKQSQTELTVFSATMQEFGVANADTAEAMQSFTKQMSMNANEAIKAQKEIVATADKLGVAPGKMMAEFNQVSGRLSALGRDGVKAFKSLSAAAKETGLSVSKLLDITEKFDTFEGAAESVGKLNAILGGPFLDSMSMVMETDPSKRFKALRQSVLDAGLSFENMSYYQRKAVASAAGLSDVSDLAKLMSGELERSTEAGNADAMSKERMAEMAKKAQSIMEKLTNMVHAFAIAMDPVINAIKYVLDAFMSLNTMLGGYFVPTMMGALVVIKGMLIINKLGGFVKAASTAFSALKMGLMKIIPVIGASAAAQAAKNTQDIASVPAAAAAGAAVKAQSTTMSTAVPTLLAFGAAVLMIGAGVYFAASGIAKMAEAFKGMSIGEMALLVGILVGIGVGIALLASISTVAVIPLLGLGLALLMIGGAIALVGLGIKMMGEGIGKMIDSLANISFGTIVNLMGVAFAIKEIGKAMSDIPLVTSLLFTATMFSISNAAKDIAGAEGGVASFKEMITVANTVETKAVENVKNLVEQAKAYKETQQDSKAGVFDPFVQMLKSAIGGGTKSGAGAGGERTIILQLDGRVLDKHIINVFENEMKPRRS